MASKYPSETNAHIAKSIISSSPPQSDFSPCDSEPPLQFMCCFGGHIFPTRHNADQLYYVGGNTRILTLTRPITFSSLLTELSDLSGSTEISVKYYLPNEDLDSLISVTNDKDVENMMVMYGRSIRNVIHGSAQLLRIFIFSNISKERNLTKLELEYPRQEKLARDAILVEYMYEQDGDYFPTLEEPEEEKLARTAITLETSPSEFELDDAERKADTYISPSAMENMSVPELMSLFENMCGIQFDHPDVCEVSQLLLQKCSRIPGAVVVLAGLVRRNLEEPSTTLLAILHKAYDLLVEQSLSIAKVTSEMLPSKQTRDCFLYYFNHNITWSSTVQIITHWIVEGYLDGSNSLEEAYEKGQDILTELIDCSLLIRHDAEHVNIQFPTLFDDTEFIYVTVYCIDRIFIRTHPLLFNEDLDIKYSKGTAAVSSGVRVVCVYGNEERSPHEIPDDFFEEMIRVSTISLFRIGITSLPSSFSEMGFLEVLILRDCRSLKDVSQIHRLSELKNINLSGCCSLTELPDDFFKYIRRLLHLNLSYTQLKQLPSSFYASSRLLKTLILQGCSHIDQVSIHSPKPLTSSSQLYILDLSGTKVVRLQFLSKLYWLRDLLLRDCCMIEALPSLDKNVERVDLSGSVSFRNFEAETLGDGVRYLDLSGTRIEVLPSFSEKSQLMHLLLKGCPHLEELPHLKLQNLQVLNLSGSIHFKKFNNASLGKLPLLKTLDLSETQVTQLPNLSECSHLRSLILRNCLKLETLPQLNDSSTLKVLDLSGSSAFKQFHNLGKNAKLETFPYPGGLSRLNVLDLSGAISFLGFQDHSFDDRYLLQVLDVSETQVVELPLLSGCVYLRKLLLRNCSKLKRIPPLDKHPRLEVLDLSGTKNLDMSVLSECHNLRQISLRGCSNVESLSFDRMRNLEKVDLSETSIQMLPSCFSDFGNLNQLLLEDCSNLKTLPKLEVLEKLELLDISQKSANEISSGISEWTHSRILVTLNQNFHSEFECRKVFERYYVVLCSLKNWGKEKDIYLQRQEVTFKDVYYQTNHIPHLNEEPVKFFKICGFQNIPSCAEKVLVHAELLYLENNSFITRLSDLGAKQVKVMKEYWIESCHSIQSCFYGEEEEENDALGSLLQTLWISKLSNLKCLFRDIVNSKSFKYLKNLYIECCPGLITLFSSHLELKHLEMLKIKFCDKLENVSGDMVLAEQTFPRLKTLSLWKLPKLNRVCTGVLPSLKYLAVKKCPKLKKLPFSLNSTSRSLKIKGEKLWWDNLECEDDTIKFHISFTELPQFL